MASWGLEEVRRLWSGSACQVLYLNDLTSFYYPLPLSNLVGSLSNHRLLRISTNLFLPAEAPLTLHSPALLGRETLPLVQFIHHFC